MLVVQSSRGIGLVGPGYYAPVPSVEVASAWLRVLELAAPRQIAAADHDRIRAHIAANPAVDVAALADRLAPGLAEAVSGRVGTLTDATMDRIRDAGVEANERTTGTISGSRVTFARRTQD